MGRPSSRYVSAIYQSMAMGCGSLPGAAAGARSGSAGPRQGRAPILSFPHPIPNRDWCLCDSMTRRQFSFSGPAGRPAGELPCFLRSGRPRRSRSRRRSFFLHRVFTMMRETRKTKSKREILRAGEANDPRGGRLCARCGESRDALQMSRG